MTFLPPSGNPPDPDPSSPNPSESKDVFENDPEVDPGRLIANNDRPKTTSHTEGTLSPNPNPPSDRPLPHPSSLGAIEINFQNLLTITDPLDQNFQLVRQAQDLGLSPESYQHLFDTYCQRMNSLTDKDAFLLQPLKLADRKIGDVVQWFQGLSLLQLASVLGELTLLLALISYVVDAPKRQQEAINNARTAIADRVDQPFSHGRREAVEFLNQQCVPIVGFDMTQASMPQLQLNQCHTWRITPQSFRTFPPHLRWYQGADLSNTNWQGADLQGANLTYVDFQGANLAGVNLNGANLTGANFTGANLAEAQLNSAQLDGATFDHANLQGAQMMRSSLKGAEFNHTVFRDASLAWSNLEGSSFFDADLTGANLSRTNLQGTDFYRSNLSQSHLRHANLQNRASLRETQLTGSDLRSVFWDSVDQVHRAKDWQTARLDPDWETAVGKTRNQPRIGLIMSSTGSIFHSYRLGMQSVSGFIPMVRLLRQGEAVMIQDLVDAGAEAILLRPDDPELSVPAIRSAYEQGVAVVTIGECLKPEDAQRYTFGCYESSSEAMGYESASFMAQTLKRNYPDQVVRVAVFDGVKLGRLYPYYRGFRSAMADSGLDWEEVISGNVSSRADRPQILSMLQDNPDIQAIWSASNAVTETSVDAVQYLKLTDKIQVFGILDLTPDKAQMLLDPTNPLQLIVDQNPLQAGKMAAERALEVLINNQLTYTYRLIPHRILHQDDREAVEASIVDMNQLGDKTRSVN